MEIVARPLASAVAPSNTVVLDVSLTSVLARRLHQPPPLHLLLPPPARQLALTLLAEAQLDIPAKDQHSE